MTTNEDPIPVLAVYTADRIEYHAADCGHRIPVNAETMNRAIRLTDLREIDAESVNLRTEHCPVQPCLRKILKAATS